jgi:hypothetical protein
MIEPSKQNNTATNNPAPKITDPETTLREAALAETTADADADAEDDPDWETDVATVAVLVTPPTPVLVGPGELEFELGKTPLVVETGRLLLDCGLPEKTEEVELAGPRSVS